MTMWYDLVEKTPLLAVDPNARVIAYGDGFFTTMAVLSGQIAWLSYHRRRIIDSCECLKLTLDIDSTIEQLQLHAITMGEGILKLIVCRTNQAKRGYGFEQGLAHSWLNVTPMAMAGDIGVITRQPEGQARCLNQQIAGLPRPLTGLKLLNAQDKVLASHELMLYQPQLNHNNANVEKTLPLVEGLVQDVFGNWVEGTYCNLFYQCKNDASWYTPPVHQSGVAGVMRQVLLDAFRSTGQAAAERVLTNDDLTSLSSLFFCNAVRGVIPIRQLTLPDNTFLTLTSHFNIPKITSVI